MNSEIRQYLSFLIPIPPSNSKSGRQREVVEQAGGAHPKMRQHERAGIEQRHATVFALPRLARVLSV